MLAQEQNGGLPGGHIQVQTAELQIVAVPVVDLRTQQVLKPPLAASQTRERQPNVALALVRGVVHGREQPLLPGPLPGEDQEAIARPVAIPGGGAFEQLPTALAHQRLAEYGKQPLVE